MHFTANNEPRALDVLGDLDPSIFNEVILIVLISFILKYYLYASNMNNNLIYFLIT